MTDSGFTPFAVGDGEIHGVRRGEGTPLVFLHGLGSDSASSCAAFEGVDGFEFVFPDQRGHGRSALVRSVDAFTIDAMVDDVARIVDGLGLTRPVVGGGSMGAAVALSYALAGAGPLEALVLVAPAISNVQHPSAPMFLEVADRIDAVGLPRAADETRDALIAGGLSEADADSSVDPWRTQDGTSLANCMRAAIRWRVDAEGSGLREFDAPVVIVASEGDPWHPAALARTFAALAPRSDLTVAAGIADLVAPGAIGSQVVAGLERMGVR